MYGNRVKETSTGTGTGNLTLAGAVTGFVTFNTTFNTDMPFHYYILHDTDNTWEQGIGHLSASTTLVRNTFIDSSTGSVVNFASGGLTIIASPSAGSLDDATFAFDNDTALAGPQLRDDVHSFNSMVTDVQTADRIIGGRFHTSVGLLVDTAAIECTAAVASTNIKLALYRLNQNGDAQYRVVSCRTNTFDTATTGLKTASLDEGSTWIGPGDYLLVWVSNGAQTMRTMNVATQFGGSFAGSSATQILHSRGLFADSHTFSTALPEPLAVTWVNASSVDHPTAIFF